MENDLSKMDTAVSLEHSSDEELLMAVADRDAAASDELHRRYAKDLRRFVDRRVHPSETDEVLQEVLFRILFGACSFAGGSSVRSWIYGVARNTVWEKYRKRDEIVEWESRIDGRESPESKVVRAERLKRVMAALEQLPDDQAIIVELYRIDNLSHDKIAKLLGISPAASRKRLERAGKFLEECEGSTGPAVPQHSRIDSWRRSLLRRVIPNALKNRELLQ